MSALDSRTILFFCAGSTPTARELAQIANIRGQVHVLDSTRDARYGERLKDADGLAGAIPAVYLTGDGDTVDTETFPAGDVTPTPADEAQGVGIVGPVTVAEAADVTLYAVAFSVDDVTGAISATTLSEGLTWDSDDTDTATVADGVVTGVAAGTCNISVSYEYDEDLPALTATYQFEVTA